MRILHILSSLDGSGGVQRLLAAYGKYMDPELFQFDFIVHESRTGELETYFEQRGSHIFHVTCKHESLFKNIRQMRQIIRQGHYDIVHVHQDFMSIFPIIIAYFAHVKVRIAHSHLAYNESSLGKRVLKFICRRLLKAYATDWWACSLAAGESLWGEKAVAAGRVYIMKNAVDLKKFTFNEKLRQQVRSDLSVEEKLVIGCVGRITYQKNYEKLIDIFYHIHQKRPEAVLWIIGAGDLEAQIKAKVNHLGLTDQVCFFGICENVAELMQAMDAFVLPSRYEGLGIVFVEAQAAGLPCFGTIEGLPKESAVTSLLHFYSLEEDSEVWAEHILKSIQGVPRVDQGEAIRAAGYEIQEAAKRIAYQYQEKYELSRG